MASCRQITGSAHANSSGSVWKSRLRRGNRAASRQTVVAKLGTRQSLFARLGNWASLAPHPTADVSPRIGHLGSNAAHAALLTSRHPAANSAISDQRFLRWSTPFGICGDIQTAARMKPMVATMAMMKSAVHIPVSVLEAPPLRAYLQCHES